MRLYNIHLFFNFSVFLVAASMNLGEKTQLFRDGSKRIFGMIHELELDVTSAATNNLEEVDYLIFPIYKFHAVLN